MPGQRKVGKKLIGGYISASLKQDVKRLRSDGLSETAFLELCIIKELLARNKLNASKVAEMAEQGRLTTETILELKRQGILK